METEEFLELLNSGDFIAVLLAVVAGLILIVSIVSLFVSVFLAVKYVKFNRRKNSVNLTGKEVARKILDENGLTNIKVKATGSIMFGNSYSHYFKKVRLRRLTWKKDSISSLAMASQKSALAILDKEGDKDMKKRIRFVPLITFGPFAFIPLLVVGVLLDILIFNTFGVFTAVCMGLGVAFYVLAFVLSMLTLKTERKAQERAYEILKKDNLATEEELSMMKELFHLYNIEYVNDMILAMLELIYNVLRIVMAIRGNSTSNNNK